MKGSGTKDSKAMNTEGDFFAVAAVITCNIFVSTQRRKAAKEFLPQGKERAEKAVAGVSPVTKSLLIGWCPYLPKR